MAITVYLGVMGSGKSYEAVKSVILPALASGRRVVTNVAGLDELKCHEYLKTKGHDPEKLGRIVHFKNEDLRSPNFFPCESEPAFNFPVPEWIPKSELATYAESHVLRTGKTFGKVAFQAMLPDLRSCYEAGYHLGSCLLEASTRDWKNITPLLFRDRPLREPWIETEQNQPPVVQAGDLVVVDECWHFWSRDHSIDPSHMTFFRMHRHYTHPDSGQCCDMLLMIQDFASLNVFVKGVCELVVEFKKLKSLGLLSRYRTEIFDQKPVRRNRISISPLQKYDSAIFPLYKSYDGGNGNEKAIDSRQVFYKNKAVISIFIIVVVLLVVFVPLFYKLMHGMLDAGSAVKKTPASQSSAASSQAPASLSVSPQFADSQEYRLVGVISSVRGESTVILESRDGQLIRQTMTGGVIDGWATIVLHNGKRVTFNFSPARKTK